MRALVSGLLALLALPAAACPGPSAPCTVAGGEYYLILPPSAEAPPPVLMFLHGWGASARGMLRDTDRLAALAERGVAYLLPQGIPREGRTQNDWAVEDGFAHPRDDVAFFQAILEDAARRGIDRDRVLLAGFSRGGSMVWDTACADSALAAAYAPVAGAYWDPMPAECGNGVVLHHTHGWADRVVPLEGRPLAEGRLIQGDFFESLKRLRATLGCGLRQPDRATAESGLWTRSWTSCDAGRIDVELHPGGHEVPDAWLGRALDWFDTVTGAGPPDGRASAD
ncbi:MAG: alpha/beta hydrolase family esterase [Paracoccaceae bacterium]